MFYDKSEPDFLNWWDDLDESPSQGEEKPDAETPVDAEDEKLGSGESEGRFSRESSDADPRISEGYCGTASRGTASRGTASRGTDSDFVGERSSASGEASGFYDRDLVFRVWEYAETVPGNDAELWRKDEMGNWIYRLDYGRRDSEFGWEIFDPGVGRHAQGVYAMRPLQWESFIKEYEALG